MNIRLVPLLRLVLLCLIVLTPALAQAQLQITFSPATRTGAPGSTLHYSATLTNLGTSTVFLNADTFTLPSTGLQLDDTPFFLNAPLSLASKESYGGEFFTIQISSTAPQQQVTGSFTVIGGSSGTSQSALVNQMFGVSVVPEPGIPVLLAGLLTAGGGLWRRRRYTRRQRLQRVKCARRCGSTFR